MSNKSRGPGQRQPTLGDFGKRLGEAAERARQARAAQEDSDSENMENPEPGPSGILPLPDAQIVFDDRYEWVWEALAEEVHVTAVMNRKDKGWEVRISMVDANIRLTPDEAKTLGEALLAAWNYQSIWKDSFADLFDSGLEVKPLYTEQYKKMADEKEIEALKNVEDRLKKTAALTHTTAEGQTHMGAQTLCGECKLYESEK